MADIIITTPKNRMAEAAREAEEIRAAGGGYYYRDYNWPNIPKVNVGDRVYYVEDGYIRGFCLVDHVTEFSYEGVRTRINRVYMDAMTWKWIKPIPVWPYRIRSFMYAKNFKLHLVWWKLPRYLTRDSVKIVGGWLDPRPKPMPGE